MKKFIIACLVILDVIVGWSTIKEFPNHNKETAMQQEYNLTIKQANQLDRESRNMDVAQVKKMVQKSGINLDNAKSQLSSKITQAMNLTYNQQDFNKLKQQLPSLIGQSWSNTIISNSRPITGQNGNLYPYSKLVDQKIAFGDYDIQNHQIPIEVTVHYLNNLGNGHTKDGYGYYTATYNAKTKQISGVNYTTMQNDQQQTGV